MIEEILRTQATRTKEDVEDLQDFDLELIYYPNLLDCGPHVSFYAVNDELFFLPFEKFKKLFNRALAIWGEYDPSSGERA